MPSLRQSLAQRDVIEWRIIAQNQGLLLDDVGDGDMLTALVEQMLRPEHVKDVWEDLAEEAREALRQLAALPDGMPVPTFQRKFGELRKIGPGRLRSEQPWKSPTGPGEILWHWGWITRGFQKRKEGVIELVSIPDDLLPLLPLGELSKNAVPPLPKPWPQPAASRALGELLLDDLGTLLAYVQNHQVWLRSQDRWRLKDLQALAPRLRLSNIRKQPLEAGGPLHLLFFTAKKLGLLAVRNRQQQFGKALRPWLEQSRAGQMSSLFRAWYTADDWNDLCLTPGLRCLEGAWRNDPVLARSTLLTQLERVEPGQWFALDDFIAMMYEHLPDFQRPSGIYDTWYIQNRAGEFLRGFEHWPAVEGRLIRYIWQGPLFWLGVVALDERAELWSLTRQGANMLQGIVPSETASGPVLTVHENYVITLSPHIGLWDRLRVALFAFWQSSEPEFSYLITKRGVQRAHRHGVSARRILDFLERASDGHVPDNIRKALLRK